jgi:hypothetical protein
MKITLPIALAAVLVLASAPVTVHAQTPAPAAAAAPAATATPAKTTAGPKKTKYTGTLSAIDATGNTITITDKTVAPKTLSISPTTKIKKDGKTATLADFKVGDKVGGSYTTDATGIMTATSLSSGAPKKAATTATGTTTTAAPAKPATN